MNKENEMNIIMSVNEKYMDKACTTLYSLSRYTKIPIHLYLLNNSLTENEVKYMKKKLSKYNVLFDEVDMREIHIFDKFTLGASHFSREMYFRIVAYLVLPKWMERVLWLDADVIINGNLEEYYFQDLSDVSIVVSPDSKNDSELVRMCKKNIGLDNEECYFNSGVILFNLIHIRENMDIDWINKVCKKLEKKLIYPDQDILNVLYCNSKRIIDWKIYNYQVCGGIDVNLEECSKAKIIHYTSEKKPWDYKYLNDFSSFYWENRILEGDGNEFNRVKKKSAIYKKARLNILFEQYKKIKYYWNKILDYVFKH